MKVMTDFETQHPRIADGTFTDKTHSAPEMTLGGAPADDTVTAALTVTWVERGVIPPRHRNPRDIPRELDVEVSIPAVSAEDAPVGFTVTTCKYTGGDDMEDVTEELRVHDGNLWRPLTENVAGVVGPMPANAERLIARAFHHGWHEHPRMDAETEDAARAEAQAAADDFLSIDGNLYSKASEPVYEVRTYGFGGGVGIHVESSHQFRPHDEDRAFPERVFAADQHAEAREYALTLARGKAESVSDGENIDLTPAFRPGSTFTPAPRIEYVSPHEASYAQRFGGDRGALEREFTAFKAQLLTIPGAVESVADGWGGTTKRVVLTKLTETQARDYAEYTKLSLET